MYTDRRFPWGDPIDTLEAGAANQASANDDWDGERARGVRTSSVRIVPRTSTAIVRRRWEAVIPREEIQCLLDEGRLLDLLARLEEALRACPRDLELLRSIRVLEDHLGLRIAKSG